MPEENFNRTKWCAKLTERINEHEIEMLVNIGKFDMFEPKRTVLKTVENQGYQITPEGQEFKRKQHEKFVRDKKIIR